MKRNEVARNCRAEGREARAAIRHLISGNFDCVIGGPDAIEHVEGCGCCRAIIGRSIHRASEGLYGMVYSDTIEETIQEARQRHRVFYKRTRDFTW